MDVDSEPSPSNWAEYQTRLQTAVLLPTKLALGLPQDLDFHRTLDREFGRELDDISSRVLAVTNKLINLASGSRQGVDVLGGDDDAKDNFHSLVVDIMDRLLERADTCIDKHLGRNKSAPTAPGVVDKATESRRNDTPLNKKLLHDHTLPKPQFWFTNKVDNFATSWRPPLAQKLHAKRPLEDADSMVTEDEPYHPYRFEIKNIEYPAHLFETPPASETATFEATPFTFVKTSQEFAHMLGKLRQASEIAVDLEHHSYRSYGGFLCLMQLSTRDEDFVVDLLAVRDEVPTLLDVFANPAIVKVFHGAESDIVWLQQDFGLYIVNLFDTFHASKVLEFAKHSLAKLLETYTSFVADKRYQLADWRIRPLPTEMMFYARSDTHFLLYIYDRLRTALLQRADGAPDLIREVLRRSEDTALRTYMLETYDVATGLGPNGWETLSKKWNRGLHGAQLAVYKAVHAWRDMIARREDESTRYVMGNNAVFRLADVQPGTMAELTATLHPMNAMQRKHAKELLQVIIEAVEAAKRPEPVVHAAAATVPNPFAIGSQSLPIDLNAPMDAQRANLWDLSAQPADATAKSSLFGVEFGGAAWQSYAAPKSALFGESSAKSKVRTGRKRDAYLEVVAEIHASLVVAPIVPKLENVDIPLRAVAPQPASDDFVPIPTAPEELAFVPKAQRKTTTIVDPNLGDEIVVVGQRQKKRKRDKPVAMADDVAATVPDSIETPRAKKPKKDKSTVEAEGDDPMGDEEPVNEFDYSAAAEIFEESKGADAVNGGKRKKKDKAKDKAAASKTEHGNFKPARARAEMKAGNMSRTFR